MSFDIVSKSNHIVVLHFFNSDELPYKFNVLYSFSKLHSSKTYFNEDNYRACVISIHHIHESEAMKFSIQMRERGKQDSWLIVCFIWIIHHDGFCGGRKINIKNCQKKRVLPGVSY